VNNKEVESSLVEKKNLSNKETNNQQSKTTALCDRFNTINRNDEDLIIPGQYQHTI